MEEFDQRKDLLRKAVHTALQGQEQNVVKRIWIQIELNIPALYFPNGYSLAQIDEAIAHLERGPFNPQGSYTNPILSRMGSMLKASQGEAVAMLV